VNWPLRNKVKTAVDERRCGVSDNRDRREPVQGKEAKKGGQLNKSRSDIEFGQFKRLSKAFLFGETVAH